MALTGYFVKEKNTTNEEIRAAFAVIANNTKEDHTRAFALEQFERLAPNRIVLDARQMCPVGGEPLA